MKTLGGSKGCRERVVGIQKWVGAALMVGGGQVLGSQWLSVFPLQRGSRSVWLLAITPAQSRCSILAGGLGGVGVMPRMDSGGPCMKNLWLEVQSNPWGCHSEAEARCV